MRRPNPVAAVIAFFAATAARAAGPAVPVEVSVQGRLLDRDDKPINGPVTLKFTIYTTSEATAEQQQLWTATYETSAFGGIYSVILGDAIEDRPALPASLFDGSAPRWMGLTVNADPETRPRLKFGATPYALLAARALVAETATTATTATAATTATTATSATDAERVGGQTLAQLDARFAPATGADYVELQSATPGTAQAGHANLSGTVKAAHFAGDGSALTGLDPAQLSGPLGDAQLSSGADLAKLSSAQTFTGTKTFDDARGRFSGMLLLPQGASEPFACNSGALGAAYYDTSTSLLKVCLAGGWTAASPPPTRPARLYWTAALTDFGTVNETASRRILTLRNEGDAGATGVSVMPPTGFNIAVNGCGASLAGGAACAVTFELPSGGTAGTVNGNATATWSGGSATTALTGVARNCVTGTQTITANAVFTVPTGCDLRVEAHGGQGANGDFLTSAYHGGTANSAGIGGLGGRVIATFVAAGGETFDITFGNGGQAGAANYDGPANGGAGGKYAAVVSRSTSNSVIAGGGGGGGAAASASYPGPGAVGGDGCATDGFQPTSGSWGANSVGRKAAASGVGGAGASGENAAVSGSTSGNAKTPVAGGNGGPGTSGHGYQSGGGGGGGGYGGGGGGGGSSNSSKAAGGGGGGCVAQGGTGALISQGGATAGGAPKVILNWQ